jgi:hypothetical protein
VKDLGRMKCIQIDKGDLYFPYHSSGNPSCAFFSPAFLPRRPSLSVLLLYHENPSFFRLGDSSFATEADVKSSQSIIAALTWVIGNHWIRLLYGLVRDAASETVGPCLKVEHSEAMDHA